MGGVKITTLFIVIKIDRLLDLHGGETGIRTLGRLAPTTVFETAPFDHSGTSPQALSLVIPNPADKPIF